MRGARRVVLVHDASIGAGNACAAYLGKKGDRVWGAMAQPEYYQGKSDEFWKPVRFEPSADGGAESAIEEILAEEGRLDAFVLCPFRELSGAFADTDGRQFAEEFRFRFLAQAALLRKALSVMARKGRGKIIVVTDAEAAYGIPYHGASAAGDAALAALALSTRLEASAMGVDVALVEAGGLRTGLSTRRSAAQGWTTESPWHEAAERATAERDRRSRFGGDPVALARKVRALLASKDLPPRSAVGTLGFRFNSVAQRFGLQREIERGTMSYYGLAGARNAIRKRRDGDGR